MTAMIHLAGSYSEQDGQSCEWCATSLSGPGQRAIGAKGWPDDALIFETEHPDGGHGMQRELLEYDDELVHLCRIGDRSSVRALPAGVSAPLSPGVAGNGAPDIDAIEQYLPCGCRLCVAYETIPTLVEEIRRLQAELAAERLRFAARNLRTTRKP